MEGKIFKKLITQPKIYADGLSFHNKNLVKSNIKYIILQADSTIILNKKKIFKLIKKFKKTIISVNINYFPHNNNCYIEF